MPLAAWMLAQALNLPPLATQVLVLFGAVPSASSCYVLATNMGGDGPYVARLVTATTVLSAASLPLWLAWVS
jgi:predicted permease